MTKSAKIELIAKYDRITEALETLDSDTNEGYDSQIFLPQLLALYYAVSPFVEAMRPKSRNRVKKGELSAMQTSVLIRFRQTGSVTIYEGYRKYIRTAESLDRRGLIERNRKVFGDHNEYTLTDEGRAMLNKLAESEGAS
jgi:hypothetical protein